jgi:RNA polymerase sigma-70 factor (ECF subfamily)
VVEAMERYAAGEDAAFGELYDFVAPRLYAYLLHLTGDPDLTADVLQQTLLQVHRARRRFISRADVFPWILTIARHLVIDNSRSATRRLVSTSELDDLIPSDGALADDVVQAIQLASLLEGALARLPEPQRVVFDLLNRQKLSLAETARTLRITVGAVKLRRHRAYRALRAAIACRDEAE